MKLLRSLICLVLVASFFTPTVRAFHVPPWDTGHNSFSGDSGDGGTDPGTCDGSCGSCPCTGKAMSPVEAANGDFIYTLQVLSIASLGPSINVALTYNSQDLRRGPFGVGWVHPYEQRITETTDGEKIFAIYSRADGKRERFTKNQDGTYTSPPHLFETLKKNSDGTFTLRNKFGVNRRFDAQGLLVAVVDRNGNALSFVYDAAGFMTQIADAVGRTVNITKGADGRIESITDPADRAFRFGYDASGNLVRYTDPLGNVTNYQYDLANNLTAVVDPRGNTVTRLTYDSSGRVAQHIDGAETWTYTYSPSAKRTTKRDSQGNTWTFDYNDNGNVVREVDPFGKVALYTVDASLNVTQYVNKNGAVTKYTYDAAGNKLTSTDALNNVTSVAYESVFNLPLMITDALGNKTPLEYDGRGNLTKVTNVFGQATKLQYNDKGQVTRITDALGGTFDFAYDNHGNLVKMTDPLGNIRTATFDILSKILSTTDAEGRPMQFAYDDDQRLTRTVDAAGGVTAREYDASSNLTAMTVPNGGKTVLQYDSLNRLVRATNPLNQITSYSYDRRNNVISKTDAKGQTTTYVYDALERRTRKAKPDDTVTYGYDAMGNLLSVGDGDSSLTFLYDALNRLTEARTAAAAGQPASVIRLAYDANGNRKSLTDPSGGVTNYTYDALQRLKSLSDPAGQFSFTYDELSRRTKMDRPFGMSTTYTYDPSGRITSLVYQGGPGLLPFNYTYDRDGERLTRNDGAEPRSYTYDALYRLTASQGGAAESYAYDSMGNRTASHLSASYTYDAANRLNADATFDYTYDANGNLTRKTERATGKVTGYTYNSENQLIRIDLPDGTFAAYRYDGLGRRIEKNVAGQITRYVYDGQDILFEYAGTTFAARYTHGSGMDEVLAVQRGGNTYLLQTDALGSVARVADGATTTATYTYDTFGRLTSETGTRRAPYAFHGREFDQESGLYYFRARYYDPQIGRFITEDPVKFVGGLNFYSFVNGNPVNLIDPYGKEALVLGGAATVIGEAAVFDPEPITKAILAVAAIGLAGWILWNAAKPADDNGKSETKDKKPCPDQNPSTGKEETPGDFPDNPDDWVPPEGVTEEPRASEATGGKHRQWKDQNGDIVRRWDRGEPGQPGWKGRDHWNTPDGSHIPTKPK